MNIPIDIKVAEDLTLQLFEACLADPSDAFEQLAQNLAWQQPRVRIFGQWQPVPRLQAWYGDPDTAYHYSGLTMRPLPWAAQLTSIRERVHALTGHTFNSVLANLYRDGSDRMGWHADDEAELGSAPWIASLSLGAPRAFALRRRGTSRTATTLTLPDNSLLLMPPETQHHWHHAVPKRACAGARINLTFRRVYPKNR